MPKTFFITGISTEVGKTVAAAIVTRSMEADYWKPVQAGDLENSDTHKIKRLLGSHEVHFHENAYALNTPMSPHAAAEIDGIEIAIRNIRFPETSKDLVVEGAGGLLVPLNDTETILDLISPEHKVVLVSRHYLGSINHTLLSVEVLKSRGIKNIGILFSGKAHPSTEDVITKMAGVSIIGRIEEEPYFDERVVEEYAEKFKENLCKL
ncbi:dethiobiotin synthase [Christiangramia flava]|uniref:ATP-dependent dethiobiotin synthetase BioD n=1 Tax=Christiangramia flava JLT2011 TaxID=1229726 RepID=A0A1L7I4B5_9FLAO|nr:dethiobiotin synthase [Christiangramia flava]APU68450.1 Dethiobiotin synthetase [Christiangramia flava JLT2011]OSS40762.1 Dethiobiotin synthetase [Christiangramia flava JLT2011]